MTISNGGRVSKYFRHHRLRRRINRLSHCHRRQLDVVQQCGLNVGAVGVGTLTVEAGGSVSNTESNIGDGLGSTGTATVRGAVVRFGPTADSLVIGRIGTGTLSIEDGGTVSNFSGVIGAALAGVGVTTVTGTGSNWTSIGTLEVGAAGEGELDIEDGGRVVNFTDGGIGVVSDATGTVTVRDTGSRWANGDFLRVGDEGDGTLRIFNGGTVTNGDGRIAAGPGSMGEVIVRGADSIWTNSNTLNVGSIGTGTLTIESRWPRLKHQRLHRFHKFGRRHSHCHRPRLNVGQQRRATRWFLRYRKTDDSGRWQRLQCQWYPCLHGKLDRQGHPHRCRLDLDDWWATINRR